MSNINFQANNNGFIIKILTWIGCDHQHGLDTVKNDLHIPFESLENNTFLFQLAKITYVE